MKMLQVKIVKYVMLQRKSANKDFYNMGAHLKFNLLRVNNNNNTPSGDCLPDVSIDGVFCSCDFPSKREMPAEIINCNISNSPHPPNLKT